MGDPIFPLREKGFLARRRPFAVSPVMREPFGALQSAFSASSRSMR
jgi:hypothetical protein